MVENYVCQYQWGDGTRTVRHERFDYFAGGFWLTAQHEICEKRMVWVCNTTGKRLGDATRGFRPSVSAKRVELLVDRVFYIPESRILFVEAVRSER